jgi:FSR family fosmidomycin resistance protein-like MFS transporter
LQEFPTVKLRALFCLALIHTLVDGYAQVVTPLWPRFTKELELAPWSFTLLYTVWQLSTSVSQPVFGYCGDRIRSRWLVGLGPALAITCLSLVGWAGGPVALAVLLLVGGLGIGAFHPEAAVGVVEAGGTRPTNAVAVFVFGGMLGLGLGPLVSGWLAVRYGPQCLIWTALPALALLGLLFWLHHPAGHVHPHSESRCSLTDALQGRWLSTVLLLTVATLRIVPVLGIPLALAFWLDQLGVSADGIGRVQSLFLLSGGLGTLVCPLFVRPGREIAGLLGTSLPAACCMVLLTWSHHPVAYYVGLVGSGFFLQGAIPLLIAYSQRLLPQGRRLAASLTLGTSWGIGGLVVAGLKGYFDSIGLLWALIPFAILAGLGACLLPRVGTQPADQTPPMSPEPIVEPVESVV